MLVALGTLTAVSNAAFMIETHSTGRGFANFTGTPRYSTTVSAAPGLLAAQTAYGSTTGTHQYIFSYTPGTDADNWNVPAYQYFGNGSSTTGLTGGQTGYYNVYITWPASITVNTSGCNLLITNDGDAVALTNVDMNTGQTIPSGTPWLGANDSWLKIADQVLLTAGTTYTVTQTANSTAWTSMRSAGVMWEFVRTPEPTTLLLVGLGGFLLRRRP